MTFSSRDLPWNKRLKLKQCLTKHHLIGRADLHCILKRSITLRWIYCCVSVVEYISMVCYVCDSGSLFSITSRCLEQVNIAMEVSYLTVS